MQLVLSNMQGELTALERGLHALRMTEPHDRAGMAITAYAVKVGRPQQRINEEINAAEVYLAAADDHIGV